MPAGTEIVFAVNVSAATAGSLVVGWQTGSNVLAAQYPAEISTHGLGRAMIEPGETGWYWIKIRASGHTTIAIYTEFGGGAVDITVDEVKVFACVEAYSTPNSKVIEYVLEELGGAPADSYVLTTPGGEDFFTVSGVVPQIGRWSNDRRTTRQHLRALLDSWCADYYVDPDGILRFTALVPYPSWSGLSAATVHVLTAEDVIGEVSIEIDGAPSLSSRANYYRNFAIHSPSEIVGSASDTRAQFLQIDGSIVDMPSGLHPFYAHALGAAPFQTFEVNNPYAGVLTRLSDTYSAIPCFIDATFAFDVAYELLPGSTVEFTYPRFGLDAGKTAQVVSTEWSIGAEKIKLRMWG